MQIFGFAFKVLLVPLVLVCALAIIVCEPVLWVMGRSDRP